MKLDALDIDTNQALRHCPGHALLRDNWPVDITPNSVNIDPLSASKKVKVGRRRYATSWMSGDLRPVDMVLYANPAMEADCCLT